MKASETSYRLYSCARCAAQVRICRSCDRGNRYCAEGCAQLSRRESLRRAGARYQQSYRGACSHALLPPRLRARRAQKVTHQGSLGSARALIVARSLTVSEDSPDDACLRLEPCVRDIQQRRAYSTHLSAAAIVQRCCFCGCVLPAYARLGPLRR
jgi:hypothetical protein